MINKEEIIEKMAEAIDGYMPDDGRAYPSELMAEAALNALCQSLPNIEAEGRLSVIASEAQLYETLKGWGK